MVLKTVALLFFASALMLALTLGAWWPLGALLFRINPAALNSLQAGVQRYLFPELWDGLFVPLLNTPAWVLPALIGACFLLAASLRPGRG
ncbi:hypothetical protein J5Y09_02900 [Roseomonas sp. PWR1]|uniref:ABC transporter permease n=1 Tax=Roseomonas nitratireducens TaxID=2820810 RepID=A0ABS4APU2_9PROT|nr:hypothetical protein [Neoroseomonas nitratireducens]MBP0462851.1 hypothetical protein [Neoroseomonas nitratireducens]